MVEINNKFKYILIGFLSLILILAFAVLIIPKTNNYANATSYVTFDEITCSQFDFNTWDYIDDVPISDTNYYKNLKVKFNIDNSSDLAKYYCFGIATDGNQEFINSPINITITGIVPVYYQITEDGNYQITIYVYNEDNQQIGASTAQNVKSDVTMPNEFAEVNYMTSYFSEGGQFNVKINSLYANDELSGLDCVYYAFDYKNENLTDINHTKIVGNYATFGITDNGTLSVWYFDKAGNMKLIDYEFDRFDFVAPSQPQITVEPISDIDKTNGYTKGYRVTIDYPGDNENGSGLNLQQYYKLNDLEVVYTDYFLIVDQKIYTIKAKAQDKAGNYSEEATVNISSNSFDNIAPSINNLKIYIDLKNALSFTIQFVGEDSQSGIDYAYIDGLDTEVRFVAGINNSYRADFDAFKHNSVAVHVVDNVGNDMMSQVSFNYIGGTYSDKLQEYHKEYSELVWDSYNASTQSAINKKYSSLNNYLITNNTQNTDFDKLFAEMDKLILGTNNYTYIIKNVPNYISSNIKYEIEASDIADYKKGDNIKLYFETIAIDNASEYVSKAEFKKGFCEGFSLNAYHYDTLLENLSKGINIEMLMPNGYSSRQIALFDANTGEKIDIVIYNSSTINFTMKGSQDFVMVIQGDTQRDETQLPTPKTIKIFGKSLSYGVFFGVVFGTLGGVIIIIGVMIILRRRHKK